MHEGDDLAVGLVMGRSEMAVDAELELVQRMIVDDVVHHKSPEELVLRESGAAVPGIIGRPLRGIA
jgi:hypothetical protein